MSAKGSLYSSELSLARAAILIMTLVLCLIPAELVAANHISNLRRSLRGDGLDLFVLWLQRKEESCAASYNR